MAGAPIPASTGAPTTGATPTASPATNGSPIGVRDYFTNAGYNVGWNPQNGNISVTNPQNNQSVNFGSQSYNLNNGKAYINQNLANQYMTQLKGSQATGNPQTTGTSTNSPTQTNMQNMQNQGYSNPNGWSPTVQQLYNQFQQFNGAPSSEELDSIQSQAQNFANNIYNKAQGTYNSAIQHAQSQQQYADQQAANTYQKAQLGLQNDSFLSYLKGQDGLANRGVAMTGGAAEDLTARTSLNYQQQLASLLNNYQLAQNQAAQQFGDAQYSAQQALNNVDPTQQADTLYRSLLNDLMTNRGRQAQGAASMFNAQLNDERAMQQAQLTNAYNYAQLAQKQQQAMLPYMYQTANNQADNATKATGNIMQYMGVDPVTGRPTLNALKLYSDMSGINPLTGKPTFTAGLDTEKQNWLEKYQSGELGIQQQNANTNAYSAQTGRINAETGQYNAQTNRMNEQVNQQNANTKLLDVQNTNEYRQAQIDLQTKQLENTVGNDKAKIFNQQASQVNTQLSQWMTTARSELAKNGVVSQGTLDKINSLQTKLDNLQSAAQPSGFNNSGGGSGLAKSGNRQMDQWDGLIQQQARGSGIDPAIIKAVIQHESGGNAHIADNHNKDGTIDVGLTQINSKTIQEYGLDANRLRTDPAYAIKASIMELQGKQRMLRSMKLDPNSPHNLFHAYNGWTAQGEQYAKEADQLFRKYKGSGLTSGTQGPPHIR